MSFTPLSLADTKWIDDTMGSLDLDGLIGQVLHPALLTNWGEVIKSPAELVKTYKLGGGFQGTQPANTLRNLYQDICACSAIPPIISGDYECRVAINEGSNLGHTMNIAAVEDITKARKIAYEIGRSVARQAVAVGTRWTFAPVADINYNPENPITNIRSFGDDPERISQLVAAFIKGTQEHGMAATIKHFPGDGMDNRDQHVCTSINPLPLDDWRQTYGKTFKAGIDAGVSSVMMGHIALKEISSRNQYGELLPGTLDPQMHSFLREELQFDGVIVSDAIGMGGCISHAKNHADIAVRNLAAGSDIVLFPRGIDQVIDGIKEAVKNGQLKVSRIEEAAKRVLTLKAKLRLHVDNSLVSEDECMDILHETSHVELGQEIARESVCCLRNRSDGKAPIINKGDTIIIFDLPIEKPSPSGLQVAGQEVSDKLTIWKDTFAQYGVTAKTCTNMDEFNAIQCEATAMIYLVNAYPQAARGNIRLPYPALQCIEQARLKEPGEKIFVSTGSPYVLRELPYLPNLYCLYASTPNLVDQFAKVLINNEKYSNFIPVKNENLTL